MKKPIKNSYWIQEGTLLAGEYPKDHLKELINADVKCFIDLTSDYSFTSYKKEVMALSREAVVYEFPIANRSIPKSIEYTKEILDVIDINIKNKRTVYIHCLAGIGRTGTIVGCWLSRHGYPGKEALLKLNELWLDNPVSKFCSTPETGSQCKYIENWNNG